VEQLSEGIGESIPMACQDWANTKAAYRFLSNERVSEHDILAGHFQSTRDRFRATDGLALVLHDTTEFSFQRERPELIGSIGVSAGRRDNRGRPQLQTVCGILMHSSLVVTAEGLPLGIAAVKFWTRKEFKVQGNQRTEEESQLYSCAIEEKESIRWLDNLKQTTVLLDNPEPCVHIGGRESDIYELFCTAHDVKTHFLMRTCVDRLAGDGQHTVSEEMSDVDLKHRNRVRLGKDCG
jgi:hypothetical protein